LTSFVGREFELARLESFIAGHRLVTIVGPGGSGKRLAVEAAKGVRGHLAEGAAFVPLAHVEDSGSVGFTVASVAASVFGLAGQPSMSMLDLVARALGHRHVLLVLDNCEHVGDAAAELCEHLLLGGEGLRILATSREPLGLPGEDRLVLPPLPVAAAPGDKAPGRASALRRQGDARRRPLRAD
jgi:predicted ATPase